jgi:hypothetical protein
MAGWAKAVARITRKRREALKTASFRCSEVLKGGDKVDMCKILSKLLEKL